MSVSYYARLNGKKFGNEFPRLGPVVEMVQNMDLKPGDVAEVVDDSAEGMVVKLRREGKPNVEAA